MKEYLKGAILGFIIALMFLASCTKETEVTPSKNTVDIVSIIEPHGSYKYGYIIDGQILYTRNPKTGEESAKRNRGEMYSNTKYYVGEDVTGRLCHCDSLVK